MTRLRWTVLFLTGMAVMTLAACADRLTRRQKAEGAAYPERTVPSAQDVAQSAEMDRLDVQDYNKWVCKQSPADRAELARKFCTTNRIQLVCAFGMEHPAPDECHGGNIALLPPPPQPEQ